MIDRSYLPYESAKVYKDRGMQKWMGFFLSEHTSSISYDRNKPDLSSKLTKIEKLTYITQLYSSKSNGLFVVSHKGKRKVYQGIITELSSKEITVRTIEKYELLQVDEIIEISLLEVLDE
ncbi:Uncharacterised protein [Streptococcus dysgalactiae subsp. dysgalactiae]|uniref:YolD-like protein n=1 Tax=Streptococcus dysgalactiae subsp. dysgalactiae TaxID=99822 RepID=A0A380JTX8_STRDY|nr:hypothetical protein [Streptococcus dysgalactiae]SUN48788.1 Uncharacterised protein [Streptococcus dysgalactiae subsp. dysgalactiae]